MIAHLALSVTLLAPRYEPMSSRGAAATRDLLDHPRGWLWVSHGRSLAAARDDTSLRLAAARVDTSLRLAAARVDTSLRPRPDHWFGSDKLKHFFIAAFTQSVTYSVLQTARVRHDQALASAWAVTAAVSVAKEVHDRRTTGLFSVRDLVWDAAGASAASVLIHNAVRGNADERPPVSSVSEPAPLGASLLSSTRPGPILTPTLWPQWRLAGAPLR